MLDNNNNVKFVGKQVIKDVQREYDIGHIPQAQNLISASTKYCPAILDYRIITNQHLNYRYGYIDGDCVLSMDKQLIITIKDLISQLRMIRFSLCCVTFFDKINCFLTAISKCIPTRTECDVLNKLVSEYSKIKQKYTCSDFSHCDLGFENIIKNANEYKFIDFDESCFAPKNMDLNIFATRILYKKLIHGLDIKIESFIEEQELDKDLSELYIIKVVLEKILLTKLGVIDGCDCKQQEDSYHNWLKLLWHIKNNSKVVL